MVVTTFVFPILDVLLVEILGRLRFINHSFDVVDSVEELCPTLQLLVLLQLRHLFVVSSLRFLRHNKVLLIFQIVFLGN